MTLLVKQCCCGCSLRTGTAIIGVYMLTTSLLVTILASVSLGLSYDATEYRRHYGGNRVDYYDILHPNVGIDAGYRITMITIIVAAILQSGLNALLLFGVKKEKRNIVVAWFVAYTIILGICILSFVTNFFQDPFNPVYQTASFIGIVVNAYFLLVVRSYYHSLPDGQQRRQNISMVFGGEETNIKPVPLK